MIAYYSQDSDSSSRVLLRDVNGGEPITLLADISSIPRYFGGIEWSNDGARLAINAEVEGQKGIYIIPRLGGQPRTYNTNTNGLYHSWSPDGERLAVLYFAGEGLQIIDLRTMSADYVELENLIERPLGISWSEHTNKVALASRAHRSQHGKIWSFLPDGTDKQVIVEDTLALISPRWGSGGESIYYLKGDREMELWNVDAEHFNASKRAQPRLVQKGLKKGTHYSLSENTSSLVYYSNIQYSNLWLIGMEGSEFEEPIKLTQGTAHIRNPKISPDNQQIAFFMEHMNGDDIFTASMEGGALKQRTFLLESPAEMAWSPDGARLAFTVWSVGKPSRLRTYDMRSNKVQTYENTAPNLQVAWKDHTHILYQQGGNRNFSILDTKTESEVPLVSNDSVGWMFNPVPSPDGKYIVVAWNRVQIPPKGLWIISTEDGSQQLVKGHEDDIDSLKPLKWSTDGAWIYATHSLRSPQELVKVSVDGSVVQAIGTIPGENIRSLDITSDGKYVIVALPEAVSDVWLVENFYSNM